MLSDASKLIVDAYVFAKQAHEAVGQVRKYCGSPYIVHPVEVASIVQTVRHTDVMVAAALLHDTKEDAGVTLEEIEARFGREVSELVMWLSDVSTPECGNRQVRKALDRDHIARAPAAAKTIKLADLISNTRTIVAYDPAFAAVYLPEKIALLEVLREGDPVLWGRALHQVHDGLSRLKQAKQAV